MSRTRQSVNHRQGRQRRAGRRRGAAAVEFAIVAPLLFLVIMSSIEFGRGMLVQQVLTNASRAGAREGSLPNSTESDVIAAANDYASAAGINSLEVIVTPNPSTAKAGDQITVTVNVDFADVTWLPSPWFLGGMELSAVSVMRKEGFE